MVDMQGLSIFQNLLIIKDWEGDVDKLNSILRLSIEQQRVRNPEGIYRSNAAGTHHTDDNLLKWCGPEGKKLGAMFGECFQALGEAHAVALGGAYDMRLSAWGMVYSDRGYATVHTHPNCHFSGVYYVDGGDAQELTMATGYKVAPGDIEFVDPRGNGQMSVAGLKLQSATRIKPKAGRMIVFPSWLPHFVHPVMGDKERISIACNANILRYTPPPKKG